MNLTQIFIILAIGLLGGIVGGALGVGGGIIVVPSLVFFLGFSQHLSQGTSLAAMLPPIAVFAVMYYYKNGFVDIKVALILTVTFVIGSYIGSVISIKLPAETLKKIFGIFMIIAAIKMIWGK